MSALKLATGQAIPLLGFGTWKLRDGEEAYHAVLTALRAGYRHIDTAKVYGNEASVGRAIHDSGLARQEIFITTKLANHDHDDPLAAAQASLERLAVDYVDLYLIHWPTSQRNHSWQVLQKLVEEGKAKALGVSNFTVRHLQELDGPVPTVNQVELSPFLYQRELIDFCQRQGIVVEAYSPLVHGERLQDPAIANVAEAVGRTPAQVLLRWAVQHDLVVLPKSSHPDRIAENAAIFDFALTAETMAQLDSLDEGYRTCWDPSEIE